MTVRQITQRVTGTTVLTFNYTVSDGDNSTDLDYTNDFALILNDGTIADAAGNNANLTLPAPATANSLGANKDIVIDTAAPTVTNVSSDRNGTYTVNDKINIFVTFSENVIVTGIPQITLETGTTDSTVNYTMTTGNDTLTFEYTVSDGDNSPDLDYTNDFALTLNGGATIADTVKPTANNANLTLPAPGAANSLGGNQAIIINTTIPDTTAPTVASVSSDIANGTYGVGDHNQHNRNLY